eukprot:tig00000802_g4291.t1
MPTDLCWDGLQPGALRSAAFYRGGRCGLAYDSPESRKTASPADQCHFLCDDEDVDAMPSAAPSSLSSEDGETSTADAAPCAEPQPADGETGAAADVQSREQEPLVVQRDSLPAPRSSCILAGALDSPLPAGMRRGRRRSLPNIGDVPIIKPLTSSRPSSPSPPPDARLSGPAGTRHVPLPSSAGAGAANPALCECSFRILVADDHQMNRMLASRVFARYCPLSAVDVMSDGQSALDAFLRAAADRPYDALILDIEMPLLDGLGSARAMRGAERQMRGRRARLLAWSTTVGDVEGQREACDEAGFDASLPKPCPPHALLNAALADLPHGPCCSYRRRSSGPSPALDSDALASALAAAASLSEPRP